MAIKSFNSIGGFSVGEVPANIILANGDITTSNFTANGIINLTASPNVSLGNIANIHITGGTTGQVIQTDGSGVLTFVTIDTWRIQNGNSNVQVAANSNVTISVAGNANIATFTDTGANILGTLSVSGNANVGNLGTNGILSAGGNVTGANIVTGGLVTAVGNIVGGNINTSGVLSVNGNANVGNLGTTGVYATSLSATANANIGNIGTGGLITATGNVTAGNLVTGGEISATGNANIGNIGTTGILTVGGNANVGNIGTSGLITATGNIQGGNLNTAGIVTAGGTVTGGNLVTAGSLSVGGNANIGNIGTAGVITATGNIQGGNLVTAGQISSTGNLSTGNIYATGVIDIHGTAQSNIYGNLWMDGKHIINLANPTNDQDAATKYYVDSVAQGLHIHDSCIVATPDTLANLSSGTTSYNNGTSGVGAYIQTTGTYLLIDGANVQTVGTRILVKNESNAAWNGIYTYANTTHLVRATDFDTSAEAAGGDFTFVTSGSLYSDTGWVQTTDNPTLGTSPIVWAQFSGAGTYTAGDGLTLIGSQFNVNTAQPNITSTGTLTSLSVSGNANIGNIGTGGIINATNTITGGNLATAGTLSAGGNANVGNLGTGGLITATGNITGGNISTAGVLTVSGNANVGGILTDNYYYSNGAPVDFQQAAGANNEIQFNSNDDFAASANLTFDPATNTLTVTGNATVTGTLVAGSISTSGISNGTSNLTIPAVNGNVNISSAGNANVFVVTGTGANISGTISASGNANVGNLGTGGLITATGNIGGGNINTGGVVSATGNITGGNLITAGVISATGNANVGNLGTGGLITATGNVTGGNLVTGGVVTATGNITGGNIITGGLVSATGNVSGNNVTAVTYVTVGNTYVTWANTTTNTTSSDQTIANINLTGLGVSGVEYMIKGVDATGLKYTVCTIQAVTDGSSVDYAQYGGQTLGGTTGSFGLNLASASGNTYLNLGVTPASSNSTVWTVQYRMI